MKQHFGGRTNFGTASKMTIEVSPPRKFVPQQGMKIIEADFKVIESKPTKPE